MKGNKYMMLLRVRPEVFQLLLVISLCSCSNALEQKEYISWVEAEENGLHITRALGGFTFEVQYKPTAYAFLQNYSEMPNSEEDFNLDEQLSNLAGMQYYTLIIGLENLELDLINYGSNSDHEIAQKLYYYSYQFQNHIYIEEEDGTKLPCILYHFERSYDLKPSRTFVLGFENPNKNNGSSKLIIDSPVLKTGPVKFTVNKKNIPELKHPLNAS